MASITLVIVILLKVDEEHGLNTFRDMKFSTVAPFNDFLTFRIANTFQHNLLNLSIV